MSSYLTVTKQAISIFIFKNIHKPHIIFPTSQFCTKLNKCFGLQCHRMWKCKWFRLKQWAASFEKLCNAFTIVWISGWSAPSSVCQVLCDFPRLQATNRTRYYLHHSDPIMLNHRDIMTRQSKDALPLLHGNYRKDGFKTASEQCALCSNLKYGLGVRN